MQVASHFKFINIKFLRATESERFLASFNLSTPWIWDLLAKTANLILGTPSGDSQKTRIDPLNRVSGRLAPCKSDYC